MPDKKSNQNDEKQTSTTEDVGQEEVAKRLHAEQEQGYSGYVPDPTPNHAYTIEGVTAGEPTPETDVGLRRKVQENIGEVEGGR